MEGAKKLIERLQFGKINIIAILKNEKTGERRVIETHNIVTDTGDVYYAERGAAETPTNTFNSMYLGDVSSSAPAKGNDFSDLNEIGSPGDTEKLVKATYPQTDDGDTDNTGAATDAVTWTFEYAAGDGNWSSITDGMITVASATGSNPILTHFEFAGSFNKDSSTTLKVIVNHTANGV